MDLVLQTGKEAVENLQTGEFHRKWKSLYQHCPWATACQHPDFVLPWYDLYKDRYTPVVVYAEDEDASLAGLLTLARGKGDATLVGAGAIQAEYQCWLAPSGSNSAFIDAAVRTIRAHFPGTDLHLRYLPPDAPIDWIPRNREFGKVCLLTSHTRPLMRIDGSAMNWQTRNRKKRRNYNRLKRCGDVCFKRVVDHDEFISMFDEICVQYDVRQGAIHGATPFFSDPSKKPFHIELHKRGLLHATVLKVGGKIAATHSGLVSKNDAVHLSISTYSPYFAVHSPANLHMVMLGVHLHEEGIPVFDLTAGGNPYKEQFATEHDVVSELTVYSDMSGYLKNKAFLSARRLLRTAMHKTGISSSQARKALRMLQRIKESGLLGALRGGHASPSIRCSLYRYNLKEPANARYPHSIAKDSLEDLFRFDPCGSLVRRQEFLTTAMDRLERGNHFYTYMQNEKLLMCCWTEETSSEAEQHEENHKNQLPDGSVALFDLYVHHQLRDLGLIQAFIEQILSDLIRTHKSEDVFFIGNLSRDLHALIKRCGFMDQFDGMPGDGVRDHNQCIREQNPRKHSSV